jgi:hypothetical protein
MSTQIWIDIYLFAEIDTIRVLNFINWINLVCNFAQSYNELTGLENYVLAILSDIGSDNPKGEDKMEGLRKGEQVLVTTEPPNSLELRREPTTNSKTEDEKDNVILSMPSGAYLVLESVEAPTNDGHNWYNVRYIEEGIDETGWALSDYLQIGFLIPMTGGPSQMIDVHYMGNRKFDVAYLPSDPQPISQGLVKYRLEGDPKQTSREEWNSVAGPYYQIT